MLPRIFRTDKEYNPDMIPAAHEASHVLYCLSLGIVPRFAHIYAENGLSGLMSRDYAALYPSGDPDLIGVYYAGIIGVALYTGRYLPDQAHTDLSLAHEHCRRTGSDPLKIWLRVHEVLSNHEPVLTRMTADLYQYRALGPEYFESIILNYDIRS